MYFLEVKSAFQPNVCYVPMRWWCVGLRWGNSRKKKNCHAGYCLLYTVPSFCSSFLLFQSLGKKLQWLIPRWLILVPWIKFISVEVWLGSHSWQRDHLREFFWTVLKVSVLKLNSKIRKNKIIIESLGTPLKDWNSLYKLHNINFTKQTLMKF